MKQQKRFYSRYVQTPPTRRPLKIFASDPMEGRAVGNRTTIEIGNEKLQAGPRGSRIEVIDYDGSTDPGVFYRPVNLDDPAILMQGGLDPTESDPRFHQQMAYAVSMKVIENFERALGRKIYFRGGRPLRIFPHAFRGANAFYNRKLFAILFGYFRADTKDPGRNLPGQNVFTCLSHDIIAHELTHALVDRLRRDFLVFTNHDVAAFHEGFADIVAIFQHFTFPEILRRHIQSTRTDLRSSAGLVALAQQFGWATGKGRALRSAVDTQRRLTTDPAAPPSRSPNLYQTVFEPHERGSILVAAVFDGFFNTYQGRIQDLVRIATGGTGRLPEGDMHPDLVQRIANEASATAQSVLNMCIRAFEYLPPVDITFGDYLRALVTADYELNPSDVLGLRANMIEAFRSRGIYPENVRSLAEESLLWENAPSVPDSADPEKQRPKLPPLPVNLLGTLQQLAPAAFSREAPDADDEEKEGVPSSYAQAYRKREKDVDDSIYAELHEYARANAEDLGLDPRVPIQVEGFHSVFRVGQDGQLVIEVVAQYGQQDDSKKKELSGLPFRGGTTVIAGADGTVRYIIAKPISSPADAAAGVRPVDIDRRLKAQKKFVSYCEMADPGFSYADEDLAMRFERRMGLAAIHQRVR